MMIDNESPSSFSSTFSSISWHTRSPRSRRSTFGFRRAQNVLLLSLAFVLVVNFVQLSRLSQLPIYKEPNIPPYLGPNKVTNSRRLKFTHVNLDSEDDTVSIPENADLVTTTPAPPPPPKRHAVVNFVDSKSYYLWGVYSIHNQMKKFGMLPAIEHVVLVASDMKRKHKALLRKWLGSEHVIEIDKNFVRDLVPEGIWKPVFSKIEFFNLTQYDKLIALDNDIFIRTDISSWFDYPAPAATQARSTIEWNSGAMVIEPSTKLYNKMLQYIPKIRRWDPKHDEGRDGFNSGFGQQGFLSSFFLSNITNHTMHTMSYGSSVLSTDLRKVQENAYFWNYRNDAIQTVHFTLDKPWSGKTVRKLGNPVICAVMREWLESVANAPEGKLQELPDILQKCPKPHEKTEEEIKAEEKEQKRMRRAKANLAALRKRRAAKRAGVVRVKPTRPPPRSNTYELCFVSSVYGSPTLLPSDVSELQEEDLAGSKFYLFTDMDDLNVPGWTNVIRRFDYKRSATKSLWPKYMAWKEPFIQDCGVVYFSEENMRPKGNWTIQFRDLTDWIVDSSSGLAINEAPRKEKHTLLKELKYAERTGKDDRSNILAAKKWFRNQPDFDERNRYCPIYDTAVIGYDPKNIQFQQAATFFWNHYSVEKDMSFDQPLWAYTSSKFRLDPVLLGGKRNEFFTQRASHENSISSVQ